MINYVAVCPTVSNRVVGNAFQDLNDHIISFEVGASNLFLLF